MKPSSTYKQNECVLVTFFSAEIVKKVQMQISLIKLLHVTSYHITGLHPSNFMSIYTIISSLDNEYTFRQFLQWRDGLQPTYADAQKETDKCTWESDRLQCRWAVMHEVVVCPALRPCGCQNYTTIHSNIPISKRFYIPSKVSISMTKHNASCM